MARNVRIRWRLEGFREIRTLGATGDAVQSMAEDIAAACGTDLGYMALRTEQPRNRARSAVVTTTVESMLDNNRHDRILTNVEAGRRG